MDKWYKVVYDAVIDVLLRGGSLSQYVLWVNTYSVIMYSTGNYSNIGQCLAYEQFPIVIKDMLSEGKIELYNAFNNKEKYKLSEKFKQNYLTEQKDEQAQLNYQY